MCASHQPPRPSPRTAWKNFRDSDLPIPQRLARLASNNWWKVSHGEGCCGHYGEPGC
ncbi:MAG: hypothetical protein J2P28_16935 [Actinobacteria bacterium]|nr:hypothetical protein [Candidatus Dormibacteraeota bacterium]MBO0837176.1 hypothetical protein [Actinomycetota bacterium]